ncbi:MAG TPA: DUF1761 domain-containing protein [Acidimicrobiia bacterium]|nr:DUF1761 domain-containing protein [Acidimicrobiia bacterium]
MTMPDLEVTMVLVATVVAFLLSGAYYTVVARPSVAGDDTTRTMSLWLIVAELLRAFVLVTVVAVLTNLAGVRGWSEGAVFGLVLWIGFPLILWVGAILHERTSWRLAALHGGDWLLKLVATAVILSL